MPFRFAFISEWLRQKAEARAVRGEKTTSDWAPWGYESFRVHVQEDAPFTIVIDKGTTDPVVLGYQKGEDENKPLRDLMAQFTAPGDTVLDLGAHVGTFALAAAAMGRSVIAVDASPKHVDLLRRSVMANRFRNLHVVFAAVGASRGTVRFHMGGLWGMVAQDGTCAREAIDAPIVEVEAVVGDELLHALKCRQPAFLKMDVEGSEVVAVKGLSGTLGRPDSPLIVFECNGVTLPHFGQSPRSLIATLEGLGYRAFRPEDTHFIPVRPTTLQPEPYLDLVAMKPAHEATVRDRIIEPLQPSELAKRTAAVAGQRHEVERLYIAGALKDAEPRLLAEPLIQETMGRLASDPVASVRDAAGWWRRGMAG